MCLADLYREREPLPGIITFPVLRATAMDGGNAENAGAVLSSIQDVMGFRIENDRANHSRHSSRAEQPALVCSAGVWESVVSRWGLRSYEREYCRIVEGRLRVADQRGRSWEFAAGSAFLLLRGFVGELEVLDPVRIVYVVFSLPEGGALDWCMTSEGRTALGQERHSN